MLHPLKKMASERVVGGLFGPPVVFSPLQIIVHTHDRKNSSASGAFLRASRGIRRPDEGASAPRRRVPSSQVSRAALRPASPIAAYSHDDLPPKTLQRKVLRND